MLKTSLWRVVLPARAATAAGVKVGVMAAAMSETEGMLARRLSRTRRGGSITWEGWELGGGEPPAPGRVTYTECPDCTDCTDCTGCVYTGVLSPLPAKCFPHTRQQ